MARKNSAARRRNIKGRLDRREKGSARKPQRHIERGSLNDLVIPDGQCFLNPRKPKAMFATKEKAARALESARRDHIRLGSNKVEKRYYACPEGGCGGYHLTSRETFEQRASR